MAPSISCTQPIELVTPLVLVVGIIKEMGKRQRCGQSRSTLHDFCLFNWLGLTGKPVVSQRRGCIPKEVRLVMTDRFPFTFLGFLPSGLLLYPPGTRDMSSVTIVSEASEMSQNWTLINASKGILIIRSKLYSLFYFLFKPWPHHPTSLTRGEYTPNPNRPI